MGVGRPGGRAGAAPAHAGVPREPSWARRPSTATRSRSRTCAWASRRCPRPRARISPRWWARITSATTASRACCTPRARAIPTSCASAPATASTRPTRWCCPALTRRWRSCWRRARRRASRSCPFGGGTSVVGGVEPLRGRLRRRHLARPLPPDAASSRSTSARAPRCCGPGRRCPRPRRHCARRATRSGTSRRATSTRPSAAAWRRAPPARRRSGYGRIDELVLGLRCVAPVGELDVAPLPASAAGPKLRELVVGSEGTLGVITEAALQVVPAPAVRRYEGWFFRELRRRRRGAARARPRGGARPTSPASPTRPRRARR